MPLILNDKLPAIRVLRGEGIDLNGVFNPVTSDTRPLRVSILNLMPDKVTTETDFVRVLSSSPRLIELSFMKLSSHVSKTTPAVHMDEFYQDFEEYVDGTLDGLIITGAPVEHLNFEDVDYWDELTHVFDWAHTHVSSILNICWAAQASLYYLYGVSKDALGTKKFGVFKQEVLDRSLPIFSGLGDAFLMPVSRHTEVRCGDVVDNRALTLIAESADSGVAVVAAKWVDEFFITGHLEYAADTLDREYKRDFGKRADVLAPEGYYPSDDPDNAPLATWQAQAKRFFNNWIEYYVSPK